MISDNHEVWMDKALALADRAQALGEVPVGAVIVKSGELIGSGYNCPRSGKDPTSHAEIIALRAACQHLGNYRLAGATLYVTIEPCTMCVGAMIHARIEGLVFGATEPKAGAVMSQLNLCEQSFYNHRVRWQGGVLEDRCREKVAAFFRERR